MPRQSLHLELFTLPKLLVLRENKDYWSPQITRNAQGPFPCPLLSAWSWGGRLGEQDSGSQVHLYSPYPFPWRRGTGGLRDDFAKDAWAALQKKPEEAFYRLETWTEKRSFDTPPQIE